MNYRETALAILIDVMDEGKYSHIAINQKLNMHKELQKQDRAMISKLTLGTIENCIAIDYEIEKYSKIKVKKMNSIVRNLLRISVYQICYLSSIPDFAACDEAVKIIKKKNMHGLSAFINGMLRNIARNKDKFLNMPESIDMTKRLSIEYSMPEWIICDWISRFDQEMVNDMLYGIQIEKPTVIRINESKILKYDLIDMLEHEGVCVEETPLLNEALYIYNYDSIDRLESFQSGYYQVQDMSSVLAGKIADVKQGSYVIDVCAAPGGKALHIADIMACQDGECKDSNMRGFVSARDLTKEKIKLIKDNIKRCGFTNIEPIISDALCFRERDIEKADIVIADLPCSGLGIIGRKPDIKYKMNKEKQKELAELQRSILKVVSKYVKRGGILIYSTCTLNKEENEDNYNFIIDELGFEPESLNPYIPEEFYMDTTKQGYLQIIPGISEFDGFFISRAKKV